MAEKASVISTIDLKLGYISAEIDDLASTVEDWDEWPESNQVTFYLEWDELMARVGGLDQVYRTGQMTPKQQARYRELLKKLKEAMPAIRKLNLRVPPVSLEA